MKGIIMMQLTVTVKDVKHALAVLQKLGSLADVAVETETKKTRSSKTAEADLGFGEEETEEDAEEELPTLDEVIDSFKAYAAKHSREKAAKVLGKFKVKSVKDLDESVYSDVLEALKK